MLCSGDVIFKINNGNDKFLLWLKCQQYKAKWFLRQHVGSGSCLGKVNMKDKLRFWRNSALKAFSILVASSVGINLMDFICNSDSDKKMVVETRHALSLQLKKLEKILLIH